jgi:hypothetical protein
LIAEEDHDSRSRFKDKTADVNEGAEQMETSGENPEKDADNVSDDGDSEVEKVDKHELNKYELTRKKNVEDLRRRIQYLKDK